MFSLSTRVVALIGGVSCAALALMLVLAKGETRHWHKQADQNEANYRGEVSAHAATAANYRAASSEAQRRNDAEVAMIEARYEAEGRKANDTANRTIADLRRLAAAGQLRPGGADSTHPGLPDGSEAGQAATVPGGTPAAGGVYFSSEVVLRGAEQEARCATLVDLAKAIGATNPEP